jgi:glutaredoxin
MSKLILYSASWCMPCRNVKATLDKYKIAYEVVDIDKDSERARLGGIRGVPTLELGDNRVVGNLTINQIEHFIMQNT